MGEGSEQEEGGIEGEWEKKKKKIQEVLDKGKERERKEKGEKKRGWFDRECREEKREVVKELKRWKRNGGEGKNIGKERRSIRDYVGGRERRRMKNGRGGQWKRGRRGKYGR